MSGLPLTAVSPVCRCSFSLLNPKTVPSCTLSRKSIGGAFQCSLCVKACGRSIKTIKAHLLDSHSLTAIVSFETIDAEPSQQITPPVETLAPLVQDVEMEGMASPVMESSSDDEDCFMDTGSPPLGVEPGKGFLASRFSEESEWEEGSNDSDTSTEVLLCEDDDDIVPRSFNLPAPPGSLSYDDGLESEDEAPGSSLESTEEAPPSSACVFSSDSKHLLATFTTLS